MSQAATTNEDAELKLILKDWIGFVHSEYDGTSLLDEQLQVVDKAIESLTHYIARKTLERAIEEVQRLFDTVMISSFSQDAFITAPYLINRIAELTEQLHKLDGGQEL